MDRKQRYFRERLPNCMDKCSSESAAEAEIADYVFTKTGVNFDEVLTLEQRAKLCGIVWGGHSIKEGKVDVLKEHLAHVVNTAQHNGGVQVNPIIEDLRAFKIKVIGKPRIRRATISELAQLGKENSMLKTANKKLKTQLDTCQEQNLNYRQQLDHSRHISG